MGRTGMIDRIDLSIYLPLRELALTGAALLTLLAIRTSLKRGENRTFCCLPDEHEVSTKGGACSNQRTQEKRW
jgi:hypothetical protein